MKLREGVNFCVNYNGAEIEPVLARGVTSEAITAAYLGNHLKFHVGASFELKFEIDRTKVYMPVPFGQDGKKDIARKSDEMPEDAEKANYTSRVHIFSSGDMNMETRHPQNAVRILYPGPLGEWTMEQVSIVCQDGKFYLVVNHLYSSHAYRTSEGIVQDPAFSRWTGLQKLLKGVFAFKLLTDIAEYVPAVEELPDIREGEGVVKYYNPAQCWGSVFVRENGRVVEARIYWNQIKRSGPFAYLKKGEKVVYSTIAPARAPAMGETKFKYEIFEVIPLPPDPILVREGNIVEERTIATSNGEPTGSASI